MNRPTIQEQFNPDVIGTSEGCTRFHAPPVTPLEPLTRRLSPMYYKAAGAIHARARSMMDWPMKLDGFIERGMEKGGIRRVKAPQPLPIAIKERIALLDAEADALRDRVDASDAAPDGPTEDAEALLKQANAIEEEIEVLLTLQRDKR